ncbi:Rec8 like protein-domain-containing protein [Crucibulum laeve]|uniref:Rec8 like protein-domain-containing protein n=1 Tax=Crucibulum laeve TaxID=68775 RepID=A0A5C3M760_9AGAR|nr:Rec8 like protein-domain-containing protein [Crucibulum laeve]
MFFSPDLLAKRDSGFGLLWLAATLGAKSTFTKLPKRSVLTADITKLCDLIAEPAEPLALRLSSNLMFGVVRCVALKQEMLMNDVSGCVTSLKKVVQEMKSSFVADGQLQMAQPTSRSAALTVAIDPRAVYAMDFDALVAVSIFDDCENGNSNESNDDFDPKSNKERQKNKPKIKQAPPAETVRRELHTLDEHYDYLLSGSLDTSFNGSGNLMDIDPSSSLAEPFGYNDNFFVLSDSLDVGGGLDEDFEKEVGWVASPLNHIQPQEVNFQLGTGDDDFDMHFDIDLGDAPEGVQTPQQTVNSIFSLISYMWAMNPSFRQPSPMSTRETSPVAFSRLFLSQDDEQLRPLRDITAEGENRAIIPDNRKRKRTRLLLDARTELSDEELKIARAQYLKAQLTIKQEMNQKKSEKDSGKIIEELIWGVPNGIQAPVLANFWLENFKVQVEARSGALRLHDEEHPTKRRKMAAALQPEEGSGSDPFQNEGYNPNYDTGMDFGGVVNSEGSFDFSWLLPKTYSMYKMEPGQGRRVSRTSSLLGVNNLGIDVGDYALATRSQRSSLFPWDDAGTSSSGGNAPFGFPGSGDIHVDRVEVKLQGSSQSRRESSLAPSQIGSGAGGFVFSPAVLGRGSQALGEDYIFDVGNNSFQEDIQESQRSNLNHITLERNSFNFLEYASYE